MQAVFALFISLWNLVASLPGRIIAIAGYGFAHPAVVAVAAVVTLAVAVSFVISVKSWRK